MNKYCSCLNFNCWNRLIIIRSVPFTKTNFKRSSMKGAWALKQTFFNVITYVTFNSLWAAVKTCRWSINTPEPMYLLAFVNKAACHGKAPNGACPWPSIGGWAFATGGKTIPHENPCVGQQSSRFVSHKSGVERTNGNHKKSLLRQNVSPGSMPEDIGMLVSLLAPVIGEGAAPL